MGAGSISVEILDCHQPCHAINVIACCKDGCSRVFERDQFHCGSGASQRLDRLRPFAQLQTGFGPGPCDAYPSPLKVAFGDCHCDRGHRLWRSIVEINFCSARDHDQSINGSQPLGQSKCGHEPIRIASRSSDSLFLPATASRKKRLPLQWATRRSTFLVGIRRRGSPLVVIPSAIDSNWKRSVSCNQE